jgi:hypothetical protein
MVKRSPPPAKPTALSTISYGGAPMGGPMGAPRPMGGYYTVTNPRPPMGVPPPPQQQQAPQRPGCNPQGKGRPPDASVDKRS